LSFPMYLGFKTKPQTCKQNILWLKRIMNSCANSISEVFAAYSLSLVHLLQNILARVAQVLIPVCHWQADLHLRAVCHTVACQASRLPMAAAEYPDTPNFCHQRKSAEKNCSRRKRHRICKVRSAAAKSSAEFAILLSLELFYLRLRRLSVQGISVGSVIVPHI